MKQVSSLLSILLDFLLRTNCAEPPLWTCCVESVFARESIVSRANITVQRNRQRGISPPLCIGLKEVAGVVLEIVLAILQEKQAESIFTTPGAHALLSADESFAPCVYFHPLLLPTHVGRLRLFSRTQMQLHL